MFFYRKCSLCPRKCGVDRENGNTGYCGETSALRLAFAGIHRGEEPPVTGKGGSGAVFVSGCNLGCSFCQNFQISKKGIGKIVSDTEFAALCLALQERGAENINIVTGSHAVPAIANGIKAARARGLVIPALWNSSGYEGEESLELLKDFADVYLPDIKTLDPEIAARFFNAPDYPARAKEAILKMIEYRELRAGETITSGVMIRHLVIPGYLESTRKVLRWFAENCRNRALLSLMTQYTPVYGGAGKEEAVPGSYVSKSEYEAVLFMLEEFGINDGFCQELITGSDWLPDFTMKNPFSSELSVPVWHYALNV